MNKYIKSKKHTKVNHIGASVATAAVIMTSPMALYADNTALNDVEVIGTQDSYRVNTSSSNKITQDLLDTPQTISIVSSKVILEQQASTLQEVLRNTPGITLGLGENGNTDDKNNIRMRGFDTQSSIYKDGVKDASNSVKDTFNTESVEITKGAVGADNGIGVSSGYINQVSKSAKNKDEINSSLGYNTGGNVRLTADINKMIDETTAVRVNVVKQKGDVAGRDEVEIDRTGFAATVGFGIGTDTKTSVSYERFEQDDVPDGGLPTIGLDTATNTTLQEAGVSPSTVDRSTFYGHDLDFEKSTTDTATLKFEHNFSADTTLSNVLKYSKSLQKMVITALLGPTVTDVSDPSSWTVDRLSNQKWEENEVLVNKTNLSSSFDTGFVSHNLSTGVELIRESKRTKSYTNVGDRETISLYNPTSTNASGIDMSFTPEDLKVEVQTAGVYLFDSASLTDKWILVGGGRIDRYKLEQSGVTDTSGRGEDASYNGVSADDSDTLVSWKLGTVYKPAPNGSIYLSHATSQLPPAGASLSVSTSDTSTSNLDKDPEESETTELGTKWDFLEDKLSFTAALYKTVVKNQISEEDDGSYTQIGEKEVKGLELGVVGNITDQFSITAGFAKDKTKVEAKNRSTDGAVLEFTPDWSATFWGSYKFTPAFTLGMGALYMGEQSVSTSLSGQNSVVNNRLTTIDDFIVFNAMASYTIDKNSSLQLNVDNLLDEEYVANTNKDGYRYTPGASRSALLTYNFKF